MSLLAQHGLLLNRVPDAAFIPVINLPFEGPDGSTTILDSTGRSWTRQGHAKLSTAQAAVGTSSLLLDGTGDYLTTVSTPDIQNTGNWRIRCHIRPGTVSTARTIFSKRGASGTTTTHEYALNIDATGFVRFLVWDGSSNVALDLSSTTAMTINTWAKIEVQRDAGVYSLKINGSTEASGSATLTPNVAASIAIIGRDNSNGSRDFIGYIDNFVMERPV